VAVITVLIAHKHPLFQRSLRQACEINGGFQIIAEATAAARAIYVARSIRDCTYAPVRAALHYRYRTAPG